MNDNVYINIYIYIYADMKMKLITSLNNQHNHARRILHYMYNRDNTINEEMLGTCSTAKVKIIEAHELIFIIFFTSSHHFCMLFTNQICCEDEYTYIYIYGWMDE